MVLPSNHHHPQILCLPRSAVKDIFFPLISPFLVDPIKINSPFCYRFITVKQEENHKNTYGEANKSYKTSMILTAAVTGLGFRPPLGCSWQTSWPFVLWFSSELPKLSPPSDPNLQTLSQSKLPIQTTVLGTGEVTERQRPNSGHLHF